MIIEIQNADEVKKVVKKFASFQCALTLHRGRNWFHFGTLTGDLTKSAMKALKIRTYLKLCFSFGAAYFSHRVRQDLTSLQTGKMSVHLYAAKSLNPFQMQNVRSVLNPTYQPASTIKPEPKIEPTQKATLKVEVAKPAPDKKAAYMQDIRQSLLDGDIYRAKKKAKELAQLFPDDKELHRHYEDLKQVYVWEIDEEHPQATTVDYAYVDEKISTNRVKLQELESKVQTKFDQAFFWIGKNVFDLVCKLRQKPDPQIKDAYYKWIAPLCWTGKDDPFEYVFDEDQKKEGRASLVFFGAEELIIKHERREQLKYFASAIDKLVRIIEKQITKKDIKDLKRELRDYRDSRIDAFSNKIAPQAKYERECVDNLNKYLDQFQQIADGKQPVFPKMQKALDPITEKLQEAANYQMAPNPVIDEISRKFDFPNATLEFTLHVKRARVAAQLDKLTYNYYTITYDAIDKAKQKDEIEIFQPLRNQLWNNIRLALRQYPFNDLDKHIKAMQEVFPDEVKSLQEQLPAIEILFKDQPTPILQEEVEEAMNGVDEEIDTLKKASQSCFERAYYDRGLEIVRRLRSHLSYFHHDEMQAIDGLNNFTTVDLCTKSRWPEARTVKAFNALLKFNAAFLLDNVAHQKRLKLLKEAMPAFLAQIKENVPKKAREGQNVFLQNCKASTLADFFAYFFHLSAYKGTHIGYETMPQMTEEFAQIPNYEGYKQEVLSYKEKFSRLPNNAGVVSLLDQIVNGEPMTIISKEGSAIADAAKTKDDQLAFYADVIKQVQDKQVYEEYKLFQEAAKWRALSRVVPLVYEKMKSHASAQSKGTTSDK